MGGSQKAESQACEGLIGGISGHDPKIAAALLAPFTLTQVSAKATPRLADLLDRYGEQWSRTLLRQWASESKVMLVGLRTPEPKSSKEADDHNTGVDMLRSLHAYLKTQSRRSRKFFNSVVHDARVVRLLDESISTVRRWHEDRSSDRTAFDRMKLIHSREFALSESNKLRDLVAPPDDHRRALQ